MICQHNFIAESAAKYSGNTWDSKQEILTSSRSNVIQNKDNHQYDQDLDLA